MYNWKTVLLTLGVLVGLKIWSPYLVENIKWSFFDVLHQEKETQHVDNIVLVDIDENYLIDHSSLFFLIDQNDNYISHFRPSDFNSKIKSYF